MEKVCITPAGEVDSILAHWLMWLATGCHWYKLIWPAPVCHWYKGSLHVVVLLGVCVCQEGWTPPPQQGVKAMAETGF
jgi:hypothetical protein